MIDTALDLPTMDLNCHVCHKPVVLGQDRKVQLEGISHVKTPKAWVWGPVVVHDDCRLRLTTPFDDEVGQDYMTLSERMTP